MFTMDFGPRDRARDRFRVATTLPIPTKGGLDAVQELIDFRDKERMPDVIRWLENCIARREQQGEPVTDRVRVLLDHAKAMIDPETRKQPVRTILDGEEVLPDDYVVYADYRYLVDGNVIRCDWHGITVAELKRHLKANEVRNCLLVEREKLRLPPFLFDPRTEPG